MKKQKKRKFLGIVPKKWQLVETFWDCPEISKKEEGGITLIALIITIIVMIILVGVTVTVALNGGLFDTAKQAAEETQIQAEYETLVAAVAAAMASEDGITQSSLKENLSSGWTVTEKESETYTAKSPNGNEFEVDNNGSITIAGDTTTGEDETITLPDGWKIAETPEGWDNENITAVTDDEENIIPLPKGYEISSEDGENTIADGLVIKDSNGNEFVWIPTNSNFLEYYTAGDGISTYAGEITTNEVFDEPSTLTATETVSGFNYDTQELLDYYYGDGYYNFGTDFAYATHYAEMVASVNKYGGFYIGRYETTIDESGNIGSMYNKEILTAGSILKEGTNETSNESYYYRWYGLYYAQRNSDVTGNNDYVQTNMVWGQQWDAMLNFIGNEDANLTINERHDLSNSAQWTYSNEEKDLTKNIYDLRNNAWEWTAEFLNATGIEYMHTLRGGCNQRMDRRI